MEKETKLQILETAIDQAYKLLSIADTDEMGSEQVKRLLENLSCLMYTHERVKYPYVPDDSTGPAPTFEEPEQSAPTREADTEPNGDTETGTETGTETAAETPTPATKALVEVRTTLSELADKVDLPALLQQFGADKLSAVDPTKYNDLLAAARKAAKKGS